MDLYTLLHLWSILHVLFDGISTLCVKNSHLHICDCERKQEQKGTEGGDVYEYCQSSRNFIKHSNDISEIQKFFNTSPVTTSCTPTSSIVIKEMF